MMKKIFNHKKAVLAFLLALVMVVGLVPFTATEVQAVEITPTAEGAEPFTKDFNLDLWSNENPDKYERHAMHYNGTSWNTLKTNKLYDNTFATAVAGKSTYVYSTNDGYNVNVSMDQMKGNLDDYDMMFASSQIEDASKPLDLHFEHLFVKLTFNIEYGSEYGDTPPTFYFVGIDSHGSLNDTVIISGVQEGKPTRTYSSTEDHTVSAAINYGDADDYTDDKIEVIVGDGTLPAGTEFLLLFRTYDDQNPLTVNVPEGGLTFVAGKHYEFDLKVGKDIIIASEMTADELQNAIAAKLAAGETDIRIKLAEDADATMFFAITAALAADGIEEGSIDLTISGAKTVPEYGFFDYDDYFDNDDKNIAGDKLKSLTLTDVETIGKYAFSACTYLESVNLPQVVTIGECAFNEWKKGTKLTSLNLPNATTIGDWAFAYSSLLTSVNLPKVTSIGMHAFGYCDLRTLNLPEVTTIDGEAFLNNYNLVSCSAPKATTIDYYPWGNCSKLETLELTAAGGFILGNNLFANTPIGQINLVLNEDKTSQVTQNDDGTATWKTTNSNGGKLEYTFKSITFE